MARSKNRLVMLSNYDKMTDLLNRRGMSEQLEGLISSLDDERELIVSVIDMDGLKYINDTFGHTDGDYGIKKVGEAALAITKPGDICARAGGDEFYLAGIRKKGEFDNDKYVAYFCDTLKALTADSDKPFPILASVGFAASGDSKDIDFESLLSQADENMYRYKLMRKRHRE